MVEKEHWPPITPICVLPSTLAWYRQLAPDKRSYSVGKRCLSLLCRINAPSVPAKMDTATSNASCSAAFSSQWASSTPPPALQLNYWRKERVTLNANTGITCACTLGGPGGCNICRDLATVLGLMPAWWGCRSCGYPAATRGCERLRPGRWWASPGRPLLDALAFGSKQAPPVAPRSWRSTPSQPTIPNGQVATFSCSPSYWSGPNQLDRGTFWQRHRSLFALDTCEFQ